MMQGRVVCVSQPAGDVVVLDRRDALTDCMTASRRRRSSGVARNLSWGYTPEARGAEVRSRRPRAGKGYEKRAASPLPIRVGRYTLLN